MSIEDKLKAEAKKTEGKVEAAAGKLTDNPEMKARGEVKQAQGAAMEGMSDLKDKAGNLLGNLKHAADEAVDSVKQKIN
jgi:uncharacterized protein YjbJ (UPF0337 family)